MKLFIIENSEEGKFLQRLVNFLDIKCEFESKTEKNFLKSDLLGKCVFKKLPLLELEKGVYVNSLHAIIRALIESTENRNMLGKTPASRAQLDQFVHHLVSLDEKVAAVQPTEDKEKIAENKLQLVEHLKAIDEHLKFETFLAGTYITFADFSLLFSTLRAKELVGPKFGQELVQLERLVKYFGDTGF